MQPMHRRQPPLNMCQRLIGPSPGASAWLPPQAHHLAHHWFEVWLTGVCYVHVGRRKLLRSVPMNSRNSVDCSMFFGACRATTPKREPSKPKPLSTICCDEAVELLRRQEVLVPAVNFHNTNNKCGHHKVT